MRPLILALILNSLSGNLRANDVPEESVNRTGAVIRAMTIGTTYGVLAGAFLGIASIAFVQRPGENLRNIAVGASLGLYAGILFGGYLAWSTFSDDRPSDLPTEEDYDSLGYQSSIPKPPKLNDYRLSENLNFKNPRINDSFLLSVPLLSLRF